MPDIDSFEFTTSPVTAEEISQFRQATRAENGTGAPLTFPTRYRKAEFQWLDEMKVDMHSLLHTEQIYYYEGLLVPGDIPQVRTKRTICKERRGMLFVTLETTLSCNGQTKVRSETQFVIRTGSAK